MYTVESLDVLTKTSLLKLAEYNDVPNVKERMLKGDVINAIIEHMKPKVDEDIQMSVRVRRIKESQERE